jgi:hypothetical protein
VKRTHLVAAAALALAAPALTGCFNGQAATTTTQATMNSGNGVEAQQGPMHLEGTTLVLGPEGSATATLLVRLVNTGPESDTLTFASIDGTMVDIVPPTGVPGAPGEIVSGGSVSYGYESDGRINATGFDSPASVYVPVQLGFEKAGLVDLSVLTVPPVGYYEGITP